jgi:hypothetical protein
MVKLLQPLTCVTVMVAGVLLGVLYSEKYAPVAPSPSGKVPVAGPPGSGKGLKNDPEGTPATVVAAAVPADPVTNGVIVAASTTAAVKLARRATLRDIRS